jgi:hypothetical protein
VCGTDSTVWHTNNNPVQPFGLRRSEHRDDKKNIFTPFSHINTFIHPHQRRRLEWKGSLHWSRHIYQKRPYDFPYLTGFDIHLSSIKVCCWKVTCTVTHCFLIPKKLQCNSHIIHFFVMKTNQMLCLSLIYFVNQHLHVLGMFTAHHQEVLILYVQQLVRVVHIQWIPPDDGQ